MSAAINRFLDFWVLVEGNGGIFAIQLKPVIKAHMKIIGDFVAQSGADREQHFLAPLLKLEISINSTAIITEDQSLNPILFIGPASEVSQDYLRAAQLVHQQPPMRAAHY